MGVEAHEFVITELPGQLSRLWRYGLLLSRDRDMAEDLVQATCLRALQRAEQFTPGTRLDRWLFAILHSIWVNELRARRIREGEGHVDPEQVLVRDGRRDVETNILASQVLNEVLLLPEAQRETVLLVYVEGLTYREAAAVLEVPVGTVMSRLATARRTLSRLNEEQVRDPGDAAEKAR